MTARLSYEQAWFQGEGVDHVGRDREGPRRDHRPRCRARADDARLQATRSTRRRLDGDLRARCTRSPRIDRARSAARLFSEPQPV